MLSRPPCLSVRALSPNPSCSPPTPDAAAAEASHFDRSAQEETIRAQLSVDEEHARVKQRELESQLLCDEDLDDEPAAAGTAAAAAAAAPAASNSDLDSAPDDDPEPRQWAADRLRVLGVSVRRWASGGHIVLAVLLVRRLLVCLTPCALRVCLR